VDAAGVVRRRFGDEGVLGDDLHAGAFHAGDRGEELVFSPLPVIRERGWGQNLQVQSRSAPGPSPGLPGEGRPSVVPDFDHRLARHHRMRFGAEFGFPCVLQSDVAGVGTPTSDCPTVCRGRGTDPGHDLRRGDFPEEPLRRPLGFVQGRRTGRPRHNTRLISSPRQLGERSR
jgi:hypothetical protein